MDYLQSWLSRTMSVDEVRPFPLIDKFVHNSKIIKLNTL